MQAFYELLFAMINYFFAPQFNAGTGFMHLSTLLIFTFFLAEARANF
jgi:hypothetical protein